MSLWENGLGYAPLASSLLAGACVCPPRTHTQLRSRNILATRQAVSVYDDDDDDDDYCDDDDDTAQRQREQQAASADPQKPEIHVHCVSSHGWTEGRRD